MSPSTWQFIAASASSVAAFGAHANSLNDLVLQKSRAEQKLLFAQFLYNSGKPSGRVARLVFKGAVFNLHCPEGPPELRENYGFSRQEMARIKASLEDVVEALCKQWSNIHGQP